MALTYSFSDKFTEEFSTLLVKEFNAQRGTNLDPKNFIILLTPPVKKGDAIGVLMVTKRTDDFLRFRIRVDQYNEYSAAGEFTMKHEQNHATSLWEIFWECSVVLDKAKFFELSQAAASPRYKAYIKQDFVIRLESGKRLKNEFGSFIKHET